MAIYYADGSNSADGRVIQTVGVRFNTYSTTSSTSFVDTGLTKTITSKGTNSQFICHCSVSYDCAANGLYARAVFQINRAVAGGNTNTFTGASEDGGIYIGAHTGGQHIRAYGVFGHSIFDPQSLMGNVAAGTNITYKVVTKCDSVTNGRDIRINNGGRDSFMIIQEISS